MTFEGCLAPELAYIAPKFAALATFTKVVDLVAEFKGSCADFQTDKDNQGPQSAA